MLCNLIIARTELAKVLVLIITMLDCIIRKVLVKRNIKLQVYEKKKVKKWGKLLKNFKLKAHKNKLTYN